MLAGEFKPQEAEIALLDLSKAKESVSSPKKAAASRVLGNGVTLPNRDQARLITCCMPLR